MLQWGNKCTCRECAAWPLIRQPVRQPVVKDDANQRESRGASPREKLPRRVVAGRMCIPTKKIRTAAKNGKRQLARVCTSGGFDAPYIFPTPPPGPGAVKPFPNYRGIIPHITPVCFLSVRNENDRIFFLHNSSVSLGQHWPVLVQIRAGGARSTARIAYHKISQTTKRDTQVRRRNRKAGSMK